MTDMLGSYNFATVQKQISVRTKFCADKSSLVSLSLLLARHNLPHANIYPFTCQLCCIQMSPAKQSSEQVALPLKQFSRADIVGALEVKCHLSVLNVTLICHCRM